MPGDDLSTANWPSDAEIDAALALLTRTCAIISSSSPLLMLTHLDRAIPATLEGRRRESFRHWFGPLNDHHGSTAWDSTLPAVMAIARVVWPFYDQLVAAKAAASRRRQTLIDVLTADPPVPALPAQPASPRSLR